MNMKITIKMDLHIIYGYSLEWYYYLCLVLPFQVFQKYSLVVRSVQYHI